MPAARIDTMSSTAKPHPDTNFSIGSVIRTIRGERVILDVDLAAIYGVETKVLNQAVRRKRDKFPRDFIFQVDGNEILANMRSQIVTASKRNVRHRPYAFTEHGALMLGNVLKSDRAIEVSLMVVRTFVQLREMLSSHKELATKLEALERKVGSHDQAIAGLIDAIRQLMSPQVQSKRPIGFIATDGPGGKAKK